jgi:hypothetical protein
MFGSKCANRLINLVLSFFILDSIFPLMFNKKLATLLVLFLLLASQLCVFEFAPLVKANPDMKKSAYIVLLIYGNSMNYPAFLKNIWRNYLAKTFLRFFHSYYRKKWTEEYGLLPIYGCDYEKHWGVIECRDKVVLDLGADYGSTAKFFLEKGAKMVIAVEGDERLAHKLRKNSERVKGIIAVGLRIACAKDIENLILEFKPDVVKVDIEGAEVFLKGVDSHIFSLVNEYAVETHDKEIYDLVIAKFREENYSYLISSCFGESIKVIDAKKKGLGE